MTDTRDKLRAVFLAAIMALSMVAMTATFAGGAAAQAATNASVDFQNQDTLGETVLIDEVSAEDLGEDIEAIQVYNTTDDGDVDVVYNTTAINIPDGTTEENLLVELSPELPASDTLTAAAYNDSTTLDETTLVAEDSASVSLVEEFEDIQETDEAPRIWVGQNIVIDGDFDLGEDYDVYATSTSDGNYFADDFVREVRSTVQNSLIVRTTQIEPGIHVTESENHDISTGEQVDLGPTPSFELTEQWVETDGVSATSVEGTSFVIGEIDSNRAGYDLAVTAIDDDGTEYDVDTLENLGDFEEDVVVDHDLGTGNYSLHFNVTDTPASASADHEVTEELDEDMEIVSPTGDDSFVRGDIVPVEIDFQAIDTGTVTIGDREEGQAVELNVTVEDTDGSGSATFLINTFQLGDDNYNNGIYAANDGTEIVDVDVDDSVQLGGGSAGEDVIAAAGYDLVASHGVTAWKDEDALVADRNVLRLDERGTDGIEVYTAPGTGDAQISPETTDDIDEYMEEDLVTPADGDIADHDYFLLNIESTGLEGVLHTAALLDPDLGPADVLDRSDDHVVTEPWFSTPLVKLDVEGALDGDLSDWAFIGVGEQADAGPNLDEFAIDMQFGIDADDNAEVIAGADDSGNLDEYWLPVQIESGEDIVFDDDRELQHGEDMLAYFEVNPPLNASYFGQGLNTNPAFANIDVETFAGLWEVSNEEWVIEPWTFVDDGASVTVEGTTLGAADQLAVPQEDNVTVSGQTNIAAGTPLTVNFVSATGAEEAFFVPTEPVVEYVEGDSNTWETTVDFGDYPVGVEFDVNIRRGGDAPLLNPQGEPTEGVITEEPAVNEFVFEDQDSGGSTVMVDTFNTTQGGFVAIYDADGERLGTSTLQDIGEQNRIAISLDEDIEDNQELTATAYRTADRVYEDEDGEPIQRTAQITVEDLDPADFGVSDLSPQTAELDEPGPTVEVSATITNDGDEAGTQDVEVRVDGAAEDSQSVSLEGGESTTVTFEVDTGDLAFGESYTHSVATEDDEASGVLTIAEEPTPTPTPEEPTPTPTPTPEETPDDDDADDDGAGFGVVVALLAFLGAALLAVRRQTRE